MAENNDNLQKRADEEFDKQVATCEHLAKSKFPLESNPGYNEELIDLLKASLRRAVKKQLEAEDEARKWEEARKRNAT